MPGSRGQACKQLLYGEVAGLKGLRYRHIVAQRVYGDAAGSCHCGSQRTRLDDARYGAANIYVSWSAG